MNSLKEKLIMIGIINKKMSDLKVLLFTILKKTLIKFRYKHFKKQPGHF